MSVCVCEGASPVVLIQGESTGGARAHSSPTEGVLIIITHTVRGQKAGLVSLVQFGWPSKGGFLSRGGRAANLVEGMRGRCVCVVGSCLLRELSELRFVSNLLSDASAARRRSISSPRA